MHQLIGNKYNHLGMEQKCMGCLSNVAFTCCSMAIFLLGRHRLFVKNAFQNSISPLCSTLLRYESKNGFSQSSDYVKRAAPYLGIQSLLVLLGGLRPDLMATTINNYKLEWTKLGSPILFCVIFRIPIWSGVGLGLAANHISANEISKMVDILE